MRKRLLTTLTVISLLSLGGMAYFHLMRWPDCSSLPYKAAETPVTQDLLGNCYATFTHLYVTGEPFKAKVVTTKVFSKWDTKAGYWKTISREVTVE